LALVPRRPIGRGAQAPGTIDLWLARNRLDDEDGLFLLRLEFGQNELRLGLYLGLGDRLGCHRLRNGHGLKARRAAHAPYRLTRCRRLGLRLEDRLRRREDWLRRRKNRRRPRLQGKT